MSIHEETLPANYRAPFPTFGSHAMAVSDHPLASQAGRQILQKGGNAVDAAVAMSLALGVVCPYYTGIGGGGFMLVSMPGQTPRLLDYRETAPAGAHASMYAGQSSVVGGLAVGVPGTVRGLAALLAEFGRLSWAQVLEPAIALTETEIEVDVNYSRISWCKRDQIRDHGPAARLFLNSGTRVPRPGSKVTHPELNWAYRQLAEAGPEDFYQGEIAARIVAAVAEFGGMLGARDMADYRPLWREPLARSYRGRQVYTVGAPSGGGIQLLQILRILEHFPIEEGAWGSVVGLHRLAEAMRISFYERSTCIGDPDFCDVPVDWLLDSGRLAELASRIAPDRVLPLSSLQPAHSQGGTASFVVGCKEGGMVAATESVNLWHGSLVVPQGCGFVLNNVMDDFNCRPGQPDAFGLLSSEVNQVQPGKRPASSSSPVLVLDSSGPVFAAGSAGGPRIATSVAQMLVNTLDHGMNVQQAVSAPRIHHQHTPDQLALESQFSIDVRHGLEAVGHRVHAASSRSHGCALRYEPEHGVYTGGADFRSASAAAGC